MSSKRRSMLLAGLLCLLVLGLFGGAYKINGLLETRASKLTSLKSKVLSLEKQKTDLAKAKKDIALYDELYKISRSVVPENKDQAETVRQILKLAGQNNIQVDSITFPASTLGAGAVAGATGTATPAPAAASAVKPNLSQLLAVPSIPGVYVLKINLTGAARSYPQIINLLADLEQNRQTAEVTNISITPPQEDPNYVINLVINSYIKP